MCVCVCVCVCVSVNKYGGLLGKELCGFVCIQWRSFTRGVNEEKSHNTQHQQHTCMADMHWSMQLQVCCQCWLMSEIVINPDF